MPPFAGTDRVCFVLAVATTMIAQGPGTKAKVSWIHLLPRAGPETFCTQRLGREDQVTHVRLKIFSFPYPGVLCPGPIVFTVVPAHHV